MAAFNWGILAAVGLLWRVVDNDVGNGAAALELVAVDVPEPASGRAAHDAVVDQLDMARRR